MKAGGLGTELSLPGSVTNLPAVTGKEVAQLLFTPLAD